MQAASSVLWNPGLHVLVGILVDWVLLNPDFMISIITHTAYHSGSSPVSCFDKLVFLWRIYFSGRRCFKETLVQGFFCFPCLPPKPFSSLLYWPRLCYDLFNSILFDFLCIIYCSFANNFFLENWHNIKLFCLCKVIYQDFWNAAVTLLRRKINLKSKRNVVKRFIFENC